MNQEAMRAAVEEFRKADKGETVYLVLEDPEALRLAVAWSRFPSRWTSPEGKPPSEPVLLWEWLWRAVEVDIEELALRANMMTARAEAKWEVLRGGRLVFPDGSCSQFVLGLAQQKVLARLPQKKPIGAAPAGGKGSAP